MRLQESFNVILKKTIGWHETETHETEQVTGWKSQLKSYIDLMDFSSNVFYQQTKIMNQAVAISVKA